MQNIGIELYKRQYFHDAPREKRKALAVVVISVTARTLEVIFVVEKIESDAVFFIRKDPAVLIPPG